MKNSLSIILYLFAFSVSAQQSFQWASRMGGQSSDAPVGIVTDMQGNVYTAGNFKDTADFDPGNGTVNLISAGSTDIFISKLSVSGNFMWAKRIGSTGLDSCFAICNDQYGNLIVSGWFSGTVDFDSHGSGYSLATASNTIANTFILKLDPNGNFIWVKQIGSPFAKLSELRALCCDSSGNLIATGRFSNTTQNKCDFNPGPVTFTLNTIGNNVAFILKLDLNGNFIWAVNFGGHTANAISTDAAGNIYCGGTFAFAFAADFDPGPGTYTLATGTDNGDGFILKLDGAGNFIWVRQLRGTGTDVATCLKVDCQNNLVCGGIFSIDFKPNGFSSLPPDFTSAGSNDIFICKFNSAGTLVWSGQIGGKGSELLRGLDIDKSGDIYLTGLFGGTTSVNSFTADFDPTPGTYTLSSLGGNDAFYCKLSSSGNLVSAYCLGAQGIDTGWGIDVSNTFAVHLTGSFMLTTDFDPFTPVNNMTSAGSNDCFVIKMNQPSTLVPTAVGPTDIICAGESAILTATASSTINWYANISSSTSLGTGSPFVTPPLFTNSTLYASSGQDCGGNNIYFPVNILVSECTGFNETVLTTPNLFVYPNPSQDEVFIRCASKQHIVIYDQLNKVVRDFYSDESDSVVRIGDLTPGIYFITADDLSKPVKLLVVN